MPDRKKDDCHPLLKSLSEQDVRDLLKQSESRRFKKDDQIVRVRDRDTNLYLIHSGLVRVMLFSSEGKEVSFVDIGTGGNFGELSAIDNQPRSANVIALHDVEITIVPAKALLAVLQKYPDVCIELLQQLTSIVRRLCDRIFEYSTLEVPHRIRLELLRLAREHPAADGFAAVANPPTQVELASRLSCTREAVSREYNNLETLGIIRRQRKLLCIDDVVQLEEMVDGMSIGI